MEEKTHFKASFALIYIYNEADTLLYEQNGDLQQMITQITK